MDSGPSPWLQAVARNRTGTIIARFLNRRKVTSACINQLSEKNLVWIRFLFFLINHDGDVINENVHGAGCISPAVGLEQQRHSTGRVSGQGGIEAKGLPCPAQTVTTKENLGCCATGGVSLLGEELCNENLASACAVDIDCVERNGDRLT